MVEIEIKGFPHGWAIVKFEDGDDDFVPWANAGQFAIKEPTLDDPEQSEWWKQLFVTEENAHEHAKTRLYVKEAKKKQRRSS